jgi:hypothetical protein
LGTIRFVGLDVLLLDDGLSPSTTAAIHSSMASLPALLESVVA